MEYDFDHGAAFHAQSRDSFAAKFFAANALPFTVWRLIAVAAFLLLVGGVLSAASVALAQLTDWNETNSATAKKVFTGALASLGVCHVLVLLFDSMVPWYLSVVSLLTLGIYSRLLGDFPWVRTGSVTFIAVILAGVVETFAWYFYLLFPPEEHHRQPFWASVSFLIVGVWGIPVMLTTMLSVSDQALPSQFTAAGGAAPAGGVLGGDFGAPRPAKRRVAIFNWFASAVGARTARRTPKLL
jgi:hypothetical protein